MVSRAIFFCVTYARPSGQGKLEDRHESSCILRLVVGGKEISGRRAKTSNAQRPISDAPRSRSFVGIRAIRVLQESRRAHEQPNVDQRQLRCLICFRQASFFQCFGGLARLPTRCRTRSKSNPRCISRSIKSRTQPIRFVSRRRTAA